MIVLTAAIMDVFHEGHKNILEKMRGHGVKVIVILHDDLSCYKIKNKIPMQTVRHRKRNVLLTGLADEVRITKQTDPADKIFEVIRDYGSNNILFMRGDDNRDFPGKWMLDLYRIPIEFIPYTEDVSSTQIRDTIKGEN